VREDIVPTRERMLMDFGWRFHRGDVPYKKVNRAWLKSGAFNHGGGAPDLDDSEWPVVDVPHDFVVEGEFTRPDKAFVAEGAIPDVESVRDAHTAHG